MELTSTSAAPVVRARRLRRRSAREEQGLFLAEGPQAVREALSVPGVVQEVFATAQAAARHPDLRELAQEAGAPWQQASGAVLAQLSDTVTPQGVVAVCRWHAAELASALPVGAQLAVFLHAVRDPGNAGTVIRVADAAGAQTVVVSQDSVDVLNPKVVRATAGSLFHLPVVAGQRTESVLQMARDRGMQVVGADAKGHLTLGAPGVEEILAVPTLWVFGNEAWGLPPELAEACDQVVAVPIFGRAESLNLSTAAAVCLYASAQALRRNH